MQKRRALTLTDIVILLVLLALLFPLSVQHGRSSRETANRVKCGSNLRQIGQAITLYSNENKGAFPRVMYQPDAPTTRYTGANAKHPFNDPTRPSANDITAAIFLLIRTQGIIGEVFICPSTNLTNWNGNALNFSNFPSGQNLAYSYVNPYPSSAAVKAGYVVNSTLGAEFAIGADMNPGGAALTSVNSSTSQSQMRGANSKNHGGNGQNVLYGDGHVDFMQNPFCGVKRDNIYTVGAPSPGNEAINSTTIEGSPAWDGDSVLLPVATIDPGSVEMVAKRKMSTVLVVAGLILLAAIAVVLWLTMSKRPPQQALP